MTVSPQPEYHLDLDRVRFNAIDGGGTDFGQHGLKLREILTVNQFTCVGATDERKGLPEKMLGLSVNTCDPFMRNVKKLGTVPLRGSAKCTK